MFSTAPLDRPEPLQGRHRVADFDCGAPELNAFLVRHALSNHQAGAAKTFVATVAGGVVGYYSLAASQIIHASATERLKRGLAAHPVPVVLLVRLAVDIRWQGKRLGHALLKDAILRVLTAAEGIGVRALLVHAKDGKARGFYERFGFESLPEHPLHLVLLLKDAKRQLGS
ncbi:MAG: GNAT family N-acetyltransferase [Opitutaceae bacterium]|jgi:GNAT superfamily N-acetyltransferase|nr:GNAT family N-acetyltransferase [Opitutaceae bacterium]